MGPTFLVEYEQFFRLQFAWQIVHLLNVDQVELQFIRACNVGLFVLQEPTLAIEAASVAG